MLVDRRALYAHFKALIQACALVRMSIMVIQRTIIQKKVQLGNDQVMAQSMRRIFPLQNRGVGKKQN